ncbi:MAG TPA: 2-oxo acid dehydrogenase subunit E2, partial [Xanthobacteraceae bacterium]|nr:2-oxo acid dehydrogenase subunit E2 [Xanthobacteraceae bacterium]
NQLIAVLAGEGEDPKKISAPAAAAPAKSAPPAAPTAPAASAASAAQSVAPAKAPAPSMPAPAAQPNTAPAGNGHGVRVFASPLARRLAKEFGIDVSRVQGSGPHGRVVAHDVESAKAGGALKAPAAGAALAFQAPSDDKIRALFEPGSYEVVPHDNMRKIIARRLTEAKLTIPHFYLTADCTIDALLSAREEINASAPKDKEGKLAYKLSVNDFIIKALALSLQKIPDANVSWTEGAMLKHTHSDVGVAVAIPGGLITPVVRHAEEKSLSAISNEMKDLAARGRARRLKPEEYQGGSTAISNLGMFGIKDFAAVINPPHATILAVGMGEERAVVKKGVISVATQMTVTLSTDHRAVDGALAAELMAAFKGFIENPVMMLV